MAEIPELLAGIRKAVTGSDDQALRRLAHTLKGSVRYFGARRVSDLAARLESMGQAANLHAAREVLPVLGDASDQLLASLTNHLKRPDVCKADGCPGGDCMTRVLVVDDCAVDRTLAGEILKRDGSFTVEFARDGDEALEKIGQSPPDLVLTDLQMPGVDGLQLVSAVRERYQRVPVILMTSQGSEEIAFRALQVGAASYVPKSFLPDNLRDTVARSCRPSINESHYYKTMACLTRSERVFYPGE